MKVIIYGIGSGRLKVEKYLKKENKIIGYSDSFFQGDSFNNKSFYKPKELLEVKFDFIIIAIGDIDISKKVFEDLVNYQIAEEKVIDFYNNYKYYNNYYHYYNVFTSKLNIPLKKVDRVMQNTDKDFEGLILGVSHSEVGINPQYLSKSFYNFSISSQDLFYNLKQLDELLQNYKERIKKLKYVILDMYTYTYFNLDVSLSNGAITYFCYSGFRDNESHNFKYNSNFKKSIEEELALLVQGDEKILSNNFFNDLFDVKFMNDYGKLSAVYEDFQGEYNRNKSLTYEEIESYKKQPIIYSGIQGKVFNNTEKENIKIFEEILKKLKKINSEIKIYIVLIPQHKVVEDKLKVIEKEWKIRFYNILNEFKKDYSFEILDFKNYEEISARKEYYYDLGHLNYKGSTVFTKLLNLYIK